MAGLSITEVPLWKNRIMGIDRVRGKLKESLGHVQQVAVAGVERGCIPWLECTQGLHSPGHQPTLADQYDQAAIPEGALGLPPTPAM